MKTFRNFLCTGALLALLSLVPLQPATAAPAWVVIGDSWGVLMGPSQEQKIADLGLPFSFTNLSVGGTTAQDWATDSGGLLTAAVNTLLSLPAGDLAFVYVSLGGNDILGNWATAGPSLFPQVATDLVTVATTLLAAKPNTLLMIGGYDLLNFQQSALCQSVALGIFGTSEPGPINAIIATGGALFDAVANFSPRIFSLNVIGALQGTPGDPDLTNWSPSEYVTFDCIHLTQDGYAIFTDALFDEMFSQLGGSGTR